MKTRSWIVAVLVVMVWSVVAAAQTTTWTGAAGTTAWTTAGNWSAGVPTASTDAVIPAGTGSVVINAPSGAATRNLTAARNLSIGSGTLSVHGDLTIQAPATLTLASGNATTPTLIFPLIAGGNPSRVLGGTGTITSAFSGGTIRVPAGVTLSVPQGVNVRAASGTMRWQIANGGQLINQTVMAAASGTTLAFAAIDTVPSDPALRPRLVSSGELAAQGTGLLSVSGVAWQNTGVLRWENRSIELGGWYDTLGTLARLATGTGGLTLNGTFSTSQPIVASSATGNIRIGAVVSGITLGVQDGRTLELGNGASLTGCVVSAPITAVSSSTYAATSTTFNGPVTCNGTLTANNCTFAASVVSSATTTANNCTFLGDVSGCGLTVGGAGITVSNITMNFENCVSFGSGLSFAAGTSGSPATRSITGAMTLRTGKLQIGAFANVSLPPEVIVANLVGGMEVVLGAGSTLVSSTALSTPSLRSLTIYAPLGTTPPASFVNQGSLNAGGSLIFRDLNWSSPGTIAISADTSATFGGVYDFASIGAVTRGAGSTLTLAGSPVNLPPLNGSLYGGPVIYAFNAANAVFTAPVGQTIELDACTLTNPVFNGALRLRGGRYDFTTPTFLGDVVDGAAETTLTATSPIFHAGLQISYLTVPQGDLTFTQSLQPGGPSVVITRALTFGAGVPVVTQAIHASGSILLGAANVGSTSLTVKNSTVTMPENFDIASQRGFALELMGVATLVNNGTIRLIASDPPVQQGITIISASPSTARFVNNGECQLSATSTLNVIGTEWVNSGVVRLVGAAQFYMSGRWSALGTVIRSAESTLDLEGEFTGSAFEVGPATGQVNIGFSSTNATLSAAPGYNLVFDNGASRHVSVTIASPASVRVGDRLRLDQPVFRSSVIVPQTSILELTGPFDLGQQTLTVDAGLLRVFGSSSGASPPDPARGGRIRFLQEEAKLELAAAATLASNVEIEATGRTLEIRPVDEAPISVAFSTIAGPLRVIGQGNVVTSYGWYLSGTVGRQLVMSGAISVGTGAGLRYSSTANATASWYCPGSLTIAAGGYADIEWPLNGIGSLDVATTGALILRGTFPGTAFALPAVAGSVYLAMNMNGATITPPPGRPVLVGDTYLPTLTGTTLATLSNATINGPVLVRSGGLQNVTLNGPATFDDAGVAGVRMTGTAQVLSKLLIFDLGNAPGLTLVNSQLALMPGASIRLYDTTLAGTGTIRATAGAPSTVLYVGQSGIGAGVTLLADNAELRVSCDNNDPYPVPLDLTLDGEILARGSQSVVRIDTQYTPNIALNQPSFVNRGKLRAELSGRIRATCIAVHEGTISLASNGRLDTFTYAQRMTPSARLLITSTGSALPDGAGLLTLTSPFMINGRLEVVATGSQPCRPAQNILTVVGFGTLSGAFTATTLPPGRSSLVISGTAVAPTYTYTQFHRCDVAQANQGVGGEGLLTADDVIVFLGWFFSGDQRADFGSANQSPTPDGNFTADDIIVFLGLYFAAC